MYDAFGTDTGMGGYGYRLIFIGLHHAYAPEGGSSV